MFIPGWLISLVTFPGVVVHEYAHAKFCHWRRVPIREVCYFRVGNPAGYVLHDEPRHYSDAFWISVAPFIVNTTIAILLIGGGKALLETVGPGQLWFITAGVLWAGVSCAVHAFPSREDGKQVWDHTKQDWRSSPFALLGLPIVLVIQVANLLSVLWFDFIYAFVLFVGSALAVEYLFALL